MIMIMMLIIITIIIMIRIITTKLEDRVKVIQGKE